MNRAALACFLVLSWLSLATAQVVAPLGPGSGGGSGGGGGTVSNIATTSPITGGPITTTGTIACATCVTSAAALTANSLMIGAGSQASSVATTGTGVLTALGVNIGSAGAPVLFNGALGTPSSGISTNLTGTASGLTSGNVSGTGVGSLTSLAIGGATIGTNALAVSGTINSTSTATFGSNSLTVDGVSTFFVTTWNNGAFGWSSTSPSTGTPDTMLSRSAAGIVRFGTTTTNASGSWLATNGTLSGNLMVGSATALTLTVGAIGMSKITASASAPGAAGSKFEVVCGTNAGTAKLVMYAGTSGTAVTVIDNAGTGVTGC